MTEEITQPETQSPDPEEIRELKHSVRTHLLIMAGPSPTLCAFLVKTIDFIDDSDKSRRKKEILGLAFNIIESIAIHIHASIDLKIQKLEQSGKQGLDQVKVRNDEILVIIGRSRSIDDKLAAKDAVLNTVALALDAIGATMGVTYPTIFDGKGNKLNNFEATGTAQPIKS